MSRRTILWSGLILALVATVWAERKGAPGEPVAAVARATRSAGEAPAARRASESAEEVERVIALAPRRIDDDGSDVFRVVALAPPTAKAATPAAPAVPTAPAVPWRFVGRMDEGDNVVVLLAAKNREVAVKAGDVIDDVYRVESIDEQGVALTYLPMKQRHMVPSGAGK